jgi:ribosomal protein S13
MPQPQQANHIITLEIRSDGSRREVYELEQQIAQIDGVVSTNLEVEKDLTELVRMAIEVVPQALGYVGGVVGSALTVRELAKKISIFTRKEASNAEGEKADKSVEVTLPNGATVIFKGDVDEEKILDGLMKALPPASSSQE